MPELETIFAEALELQDPLQQESFLDSACENNTLLRNRVGKLIEANRRAASFMSEPVGIVELADASEELHSSVGEQPGDHIDRYELIEQIGEGGMGCVFLASQTEPVQRRVALKVVKPGLDTKEVLARFESERQALALMDHPNIARAIDAGATPSGRPFFVMEYVDGSSLNEYCDEQNLTTRGRLELFLSICEAIQHAHHKGVIHRDIKPRNILVQDVDGKVSPKVIDFGIAKAVDKRLTNNTLETRHGQFIGTPAYMSPEQAGSSNVVDVDTRSDVYSLGATLYELLTGVAPFDVEKMKSKSSDQICRLICEESPVEPSAAISTLKGADATAIAKARRATPVELKSTIRGELDWIVMRSLEKDRDRRYATASALADDVRRYLNNEEVLARPATTMYRLRKFVARNRSAVASAIAIGAILLLATGFSLSMLLKASQSNDLAERKVDSVLAVNKFIGEELFAQAGPNEIPNRDMKLRDVLDRAAQSLENKLPLRPDVEAPVRAMLGHSYRGLGEYQHSLIHLRRAHLLYDENYPNSIETAHASNDLAQTLLLLAKFDEAKRYLETSMSIAKEQGSIELQLDTMAVEAWYSEATGDLQRSEILFSDLLERQHQQLGANHLETLKTMANLANVYRALDRSDEALPLSEAAYEGLHKQNHWNPATLKAATNLAALHASRGDMDRAEKLYADTLQESKQILGAEHPHTLDIKYGLATVSISRKQYAEAKQLLTEVLDAQRVQLEDDHPDTLKTMHRLALVHSTLGEKMDAEALYTEELASQRRTHGPKHEKTVATLSEFAFFYMNHADFAKAVPRYQELAKVLSQTSGSTDTRAITARMMLGLCRHKVGENEQAAADLKQALDDCVASFPNEWLRPLIEGQLGEVHMSLDERDAAEAALLSSYEQLQSREAELPMQWKPLGLRAVTRRLAEFYESSEHEELWERAKSYRSEHEQICASGPDWINPNTRSSGDGDNN